MFSDIDDCASDPCTNGDCYDLVNTYLCVCHAGWTNANCDFNVNDCEPNPCVNGDCTDDVNNFICACIAGYTGETCAEGKFIHTCTWQILPITEIISHNMKFYYFNAKIECFLSHARGNCCHTFSVTLCLTLKLFKRSTFSNKYLLLIFKLMSSISF